MPKVTFLPMNVSFETKKGNTLLDVALDHDVPMQHACGGFCACTTCHVYVKAGADQLSVIDEEEQDRLDAAAGAQPSSRLSCQAKVLGDVVVELVNVD